ncbi:hypothetical protein [Vibrio jasicida]|uniref:hypothetical protein n=1 Tax=Vibrio jasicida TaxID=766224 RepID=UPI0005F00EDF|nr:hypothetical protein [Vibrio jasicida]
MNTIFYMNQHRQYFTITAQVDTNKLDTQKGQLFSDREAMCKRIADMNNEDIEDVEANEILIYTEDGVDMIRHQQAREQINNPILEEFINTFVI